MGEAELTVKKYGYWVQVNLDTDDTPLDQHGERMVQISPGRWADPFIALALEYIAAHPLPED
jgi:hypothetical protein